MDYPEYIKEIYRILHHPNDIDYVLLEEEFSFNQEKKEIEKIIDYKNGCLYWIDKKHFEDEC